MKKLVEQGAKNHESDVAIYSQLEIGSSTAKRTRMVRSPG